MNHDIHNKILINVMVFFSDIDNYFVRHFVL